MLPIHGITETARDFKVKLFAQHPDLKEYIESTSLFNSIVNGAKYGDKLTIDAGDMRLNLNGKQIYTAEELPIELIMQFIKNRPKNQLSDGD